MGKQKKQENRTTQNGLGDKLGRGSLADRIAHVRSAIANNKVDGEQYNKQVQNALDENHPLDALALTEGRKPYSHSPSTLTRTKNLLPDKSDHVRAIHDRHLTSAKPYLENKVLVALLALSSEQAQDALSESPDTPAWWSWWEGLDEATRSNPAPVLKTLAANVGTQAARSIKECLQNVDPKWARRYHEARNNNPDALELAPYNKAAAYKTLKKLRNQAQEYNIDGCIKHDEQGRPCLALGRESMRANHLYTVTFNVQSSLLEPNFRYEGGTERFSTMTDDPDSALQRAIKRLLVESGEVVIRHTDITTRTGKGDLAVRGVTSKKTSARPRDLYGTNSKKHPADQAHHNSYVQYNGQIYWIGEFNSDPTTRIKLVAQAFSPDNNRKRQLKARLLAKGV